MYGDLRLAPEPELLSAPGEHPGPLKGPLRFLSTPGGRGEALVEVLRGAMGPIAPWVDVCTPEEALALINSASDARFVAFVDSPASFVAHALATNPDVDIEAATNRWKAAARQLVHALQLAPQRWLCVDAADAVAAPHALAEVFGAWIGTRVLAPDIHETPRWQDNALPMMLAAALTDADRSLRRLFDELLACCTIMPGGTPLLTGPAPQRALQAYRAVRTELQATAQILQEQRVAAAQDSAASRQRCGAVESERDDALQQRDRARQALAATQQESELLLLQLHQIQEELEFVHLKYHKLEAELARVQDAANANAAEAKRQAEELETARGTAKRLEAQLGEVSASATSQAARANEAETALQRALHELAAAAGDDRSQVQQQAEPAERDGTETRQEVELLLLQLHQVQEELEHYHLQFTELAARAPTHAAASNEPPILRAAAVEVIERQEAGLHRNLDLRLNRAEHSGKSWQTLDLRLVDHMGRPGLVLFKVRTNNTKPVSAWETTGQEDGREFMLIVPADAAGRSLLQPMGSSDWRFVTDAADFFARETEDQTELAHWHLVALRLRRQLADLPPRLRYDDLHVAPAEGHANLIQARFVHATFGLERFGDLALQWQPAVSTESPGLLRLNAEASSAAPPLAFWPVGEDGTVAPEWLVPLGHAAKPQAKLRAWAALSENDRCVALAVLDALPAIAERAHAAGLLAETRREALAQAAVALHREARRWCIAVSVRQIARRLLHRAA
jgi:hypothetical protein